MDTTTIPRRRDGRRPRRWSALCAASVLALSPLALAACGGGDQAEAAATGSRGSGGSGGDGAATQPGADAMQAFQECLAEHGIELGAPGSGGSAGETPQAPDQDAMQEAQEACGDVMPSGGPGGAPGGGTGGGVGMNSEEMQAWTECLADNGVELQQPGGDGGTPPEPPAAGEAPAQGDVPDQGGAPGERGLPFGLDTSDPEVAAAVEACQDLQPEMGTPPTGAPGGAATTEGETT